ncbi:tetraspanin-1 [Brachionichthys hirsutus]|uniref:tetraspanin-1 n=1 Tax=Brachionichthys hirsutus TaxID=412623 RepID=UPI003604D33F
MGCVTVVKVTMVGFNLLVLLAGSALLALGVWASVDGSSFLRLLGPFSTRGEQFINVVVLCLAIGAALLLLGLLGCCGAGRDSKCLLLTFFSIILIIFITEVAAGVVALAYSSFAEAILRAWATPALREAYGGDPAVTRLWNATMTELQCCGFTNYTDFLGSKFQEENGGGLPPPCCWNSSASCSAEEAERSSVQGCFEDVLKELKTHADVVGGVAAGIGVLEIGAMTASMYLYCHLDKSVS